MKKILKYGFVFGIIAISYTCDASGKMDFSKINAALKKVTDQVLSKQNNVLLDLKIHVAPDETTQNLDKFKVITTMKAIGRDKQKSEKPELNITYFHVFDSKKKNSGQLNYNVKINHIDTNLLLIRAANICFSKLKNSNSIGNDTIADCYKKFSECKSFVERCSDIQTLFKNKAMFEKIKKPFKNEIVELEKDKEDLTRSAMPQFKKIKGLKSNINYLSTEKLKLAINQQQLQTVQDEIKTSQMELYLLLFAVQPVVNHLKLINVKLQQVKNVCRGSDFLSLISFESVLDPQDSKTIGLEGRLKGSKILEPLGVLDINPIKLTEHAFELHAQVSSNETYNSQHIRDSVLSALQYMQAEDAEFMSFMYAEIQKSVDLFLFAIGE